MTSSLVCQVLMKAYNLRNPPRGLVVHTDRGSQYTGKVFQNLLNSYGLRSSMGDVGACWDNAVMERFRGQSEARMATSGRATHICSYDAGCGGLHSLLQPGT